MQHKVHQPSCWTSENKLFGLWCSVWPERGHHLESHHNQINFVVQKSSTQKAVTSGCIDCYLTSSLCCLLWSNMSTTQTKNISLLTHYLPEHSYVSFSLSFLKWKDVLRAECDHKHVSSVQKHQQILWKHTSVFRRTHEHDCCHTAGLT